MYQLIKHLILVTLFINIISGCSTKNDKSKTLNIVTTTGMIEDAVKHIAGNKATVTSLMGPGVDPHLYKAVQGDLNLLSNADIIVYNGLHLEGKMSDVLGKLARTKPVFAAGNGIDHSTLRYPSSQDAVDPHIWFDVALWSQAVKYIGQNIAQIDSSNSAFYLKNTNDYIDELKKLHQEVKETINTIPEEQRILVTAHDAFGYYGDAYNIEVKGLQGISTVAQAGLKDVDDLIELLIERKIKAIFVESSIPKKQIEVVVENCKEQGHTLSIGGTLFSDAMGDPATPEGSYVGMVKHNTKTITKALK